MCPECSVPGGGAQERFGPRRKHQREHYATACGASAGGAMHLCATTASGVPAAPPTVWDPPATFCAALPPPRPGRGSTSLIQFASSPFLAEFSSRWWTTYHCILLPLVDNLPLYSNNAIFWLVIKIVTAIRGNCCLRSLSRMGRRRSHCHCPPMVQPTATIGY